MRYLLIGAALLLIGCSTTPIVREHMVIDPHTITFAQTDTFKTVNITHSCSCPFTWTATESTTVNWLVLGTNFPATLSSDHYNIPVTIDRSKLSEDTNRTSLIISSNAYGVDTINVIAIK